MFLTVSPAPRSQSGHCERSEPPVCGSWRARSRRALAIPLPARVIEGHGQHVLNSQAAFNGQCQQMRHVFRPAGGISAPLSRPVIVSAYWPGISPTLRLAMRARPWRVKSALPMAMASGLEMRPGARPPAPRRCGKDNFQLRAAAIACRVLRPQRFALRYDPRGSLMQKGKVPIGVSRQTWRRWKTISASISALEGMQPTAAATSSPKSRH